MINKDFLNICKNCQHYYPNKYPKSISIMSKQENLCCFDYAFGHVLVFEWCGEERGPNIPRNCPYHLEHVLNIKNKIDRICDIK